MSDTKTTQEIIERHAAAFARGDVPALMADYAEDAVLITKPSGVIHGKDAIAAMFTSLFATAFLPATTQCQFEPVLAEGALGLLLWSATMPNVNVIGGFDSFVIQGSKIQMQTGGAEFQLLPNAS